MRKRLSVTLVATVLCLLATILGASAQDVEPLATDTVDAATSYAFSYQGRLANNGTPVNGIFDFKFRLLNRNDAQVGSVVTFDDVTVENGLFTVYPNFGNVFNGADLYIETAVRLGSSTGTYTKLSPAIWLSPAPYARTAYKALSVTVPLDLQGSGAHVARARWGAGSGLSWETLPNSGFWGDAHEWAGVLGTSDTGFGVSGYAPKGIGVSGVGVVGVSASAQKTTDTALQIGMGAVRVQGAGIGTSTAVFIHQSTAGNTSANHTIIDHPMTNGDPNAILLVTQNYSPGGVPSVYNPHATGVWYDGAKWVIVNLYYETMPVGAAFNVMVVKP
ncbi:MAG: hypothetical protein IPK16_23790 [Anaerolineales bacterium]|nr:hypothetical protein [Anaerolineales bacterium]